MKNKLVLVVLVGFVISAAVVLVTISGQSQNKNIQQKAEDLAPTVDFDVPERAEQKENEIRMQRGRKYKSRVPLDKMEDQTAVFELPGSHYRIEPAFPVEQSDIIITGTITDSRAFISNDKSAVYSEFQVTVNQILKKRGDQPVAEQSSLVTERIGGNVRFPSGRIQRRGDSGRNLPRIGKQYVLFLKWDEQGKDYLILTGYEVLGDAVYPLDGYKDDNHPIYSNYGRYKNANFLEFISELQAVIANSSKEK